MIRAGLLAAALGATYAAWRFHRAWTTAWDADKAAYDIMNARTYASEE